MSVKSRADQLVPEIYQGTWTSADVGIDLHVDSTGSEQADGSPIEFIVSSSSLKGDRLFLSGKTCMDGGCSKDKVIWQITGLNSEGKRIRGKTLLTETDNDGMKFVYKFKSVKN